MDEHHCPKHQMSHFEDECPRCECDRLREELREVNHHRIVGEHMSNRLLDM